MNKIRNVFNILNKYSYNFYSSNKNNKKNINDDVTNISLKKYIFYKWRNIVKNLEIKELKEKFIKYIINKINKKTYNNILLKYFTHWKRLADFDKIKIEQIIRIKRYNEEKIQKYNLLKALINLTIYMKRKNNNSFMKLLLRQWRLLSFSDKLAKQKLLKMQEITKKTYEKMTEDVFDFDEKKLEKYKIIYNNNIEEEKNFVENIVNIYNGKLNKKYKFNYIKKNE